MNGSSDNEILDPLDLIRSPRKPKEAALVEAVIDETAEVSEGSEDEPAMKKPKVDDDTIVIPGTDSAPAAAEEKAPVSGVDKDNEAMVAAAEKIFEWFDNEEKKVEEAKNGTSDVIVGVEKAAGDNATKVEETVDKPAPAEELTDETVKESTAEESAVGDTVVEGSAVGDTVVEESAAEDTVADTTTA